MLATPLAIMFECTAGASKQTVAKWLVCLAK
jgi:hypothetical protein